MFAKERIRKEQDQRLAQAWQIAMLTRTSKFPTLKELLMREQTPEEQAAMWRHIGETVGRVRKHNKRRVRIIRFTPKQEHA